MHKNKNARKGSLLLQEAKGQNDRSVGPIVKVRKPKAGLKSSNTKKLHRNNSVVNIENEANDSGKQEEMFNFSAENTSNTEVIFPVFEDRLGSSINFNSSESRNTSSENRPQLKILNRRKRIKKKGRRGAGDGKKKAQEEANINAAFQVIPDEAIKNAVETVCELIEKKEKSKDNPSLLDEEKPIYMQVTAIRIPKTPCFRIRIPVPHPLITDNTDICLFVHDVNDTEKDPEVTIELYKERFRKFKINNITQIIPLRQIRTEYSQYEQQRHLLKQFDLFLCDVRISKIVVDFFGKHFRNNIKIPVPVRVDLRNLRKEMNKALSKTTMNIHSKGNVYIIKVAHNKQSIAEAIENVKAVIGGLANMFPGGLNNIRSLYLKGAFTLPIPVYVTLKSKNEVEVPVVKPRRPKLALPVEDELSTVLGARVVVYPGGKVILKKDPDYEGELDWNEDEDEGDKWKKSKKNRKNDSVKEETVPEPKDSDSSDEIEHEKLKVKEELEIEEEEDDEEDGNLGNSYKNDEEPEVKDEVDVKDEPEDNDVEEAEDAYLKAWKRKWDEENDDKESSTARKKPQKTKKLKTTKIGKSVKKAVEGENKEKVIKQKKKKKVHLPGNMVNTAIEELSKIKKQKAMNRKKEKLLMKNKKKNKKGMVK